MISVTPTPAALYEIRGRSTNGGLVGARSGSLVNRLVHAALGLDVDAVAGAVRASITDHGVLWTWERLIRPVWTGLGAGSTGAEVPVVAERLFSRSMSEVLIAAERAADLAPTRVLLACAEQEQHSLPLDALAAALAGTGVGSCVLGACVPARAVADAAERIRPAVVVIWSQIRDTAGPVRTCAPPGPVLILAGPGWRLPPAVTAPAHVARTRKLTLTLLGRTAGNG